ncbi:MAG: hypothetical protein V4603_14440 [Pseudomonadota bacterium]
MKAIKEIDREIAFYKLFNVCAKFGGIFFMLAGGFACAWILYYYFLPKTGLINPQVAAEDGLEYVALGISFLELLFGILIIRAKPHYPKHLRK